MSKRILFLVSLVVLLAGSVQLYRERKADLEADLRLQAIRQLSLERVMGVNPVFDGRQVTLRGKVVSEDEKARAAAVVAAVEGVGQSRTTSMWDLPTKPPSPISSWISPGSRKESIFGAEFPTKPPSGGSWTRRPGFSELPW